MISVKKDFTQIPAGLTSASADTKRQLLLKEKGAHDFDAKIYGHNTVRQVLENNYHSKCAYCEGRMGDGYTLHIEHYRPKKHLSDDKQHSGYYWLAYEWSNLLLSCQDCNSRKSNKFPIAGTRVGLPQVDSQHWRVDSAGFTDEQALLLNPELDQPEQHFAFLPDGTLIAKTPRAEATIELCGLNRESLRLERKKLLGEAVNRLCDQLEIFIKQKVDGALDTPARYDNTLEQGFKTDILALKTAAQPDKAYSAFSAYLFQHFDDFICRAVANAFDQACADILVEAYQRFAG